MQDGIVYKYRDWENCLHQNILVSNQLFLASPKDFNDPFDCGITPNYKLLNEKDEDEYINELAVRAYERSEKEGLDLRNIIKDIEQRFSDKESLQKKVDSIRYQSMNESYSIFSCALEWNNILMWSHYANNHKGFCVGLWSAKLKDSGVFGKLGKVKYQKTYPKIKPRAAKYDDVLMKNSFLETHIKAKDWKYESEYRFMSNHFPRKLSLEDRKVSVGNDFFAEVILGLNMPEEYKNEIIKICEIKHIPVYQAEKVNYKFKLKRKRIK